MGSNPEVKTYRFKAACSKPKLRRLLEHTSIDMELDVIWLKYDESGLFQKQIDSSNVVAVLAKFNKTYFTEYSATDSGEVKISSNISTIVNKYFKEVDNIELVVTDDKVELHSKNEDYEGLLLNIDLPDFEVEYSETDYGYLPSIQGGVKGIYGIDSDEWRVKADDIKIYYGNTLKLSITLEEGGTYTRTAKILDKRDVKGSGVVVLDGKLFKNVIDLFSGPLYLIITEGPVILTQKTVDYTVSYIMAPKAVPEGE